MKFASLIVAGLLAAAGSAQAQTVTLLNIVNPSSDPSGPYSLSFVATGTSTTLSDGGYNVPSETSFNHNRVSDNGGGSNLLSSVWVFAPAPIGSLAGQEDDGTGVNEVVFAGVSQGNYDVFSQTFATTVGDTYTYTFNLVRSGAGPDGYVVTASNANPTSTVPEPASWGLMLAGLGLVGRTLRKRQGAR